MTQELKRKSGLFLEIQSYSGHTATSNTIARSQTENLQILLCAIRYFSNCICLQKCVYYFLQGGINFMTVYLAAC